MAGLGTNRLAGEMLGCWCSREGGPTFLILWALVLGVTGVKTLVSLSAAGILKGALGAVPQAGPTSPTLSGEPQNLS